MGLKSTGSLHLEPLPVDKNLFNAIRSIVQMVSNWFGDTD